MRRAIVRSAGFAVPALGLLALASCVDPNDPFCDEYASTALVSGRWSLQGSGERHCMEPGMVYGVVALSSASRISVEQGDAALPPGATEDDGEDDGSWADEPEIPAAALGLAGRIDGFEFTGTVQGTCVNFETRELLPGGAMVDTRFKSTAYDEGTRLTGTFATSGPAGCNGEGSFTARIER